ncbi:MAG: hypothetical protein AAF974_05265 [Cyanobacteria bacterium P01_E01_bin.34]
MPSRDRSVGPHTLPVPILHHYLAMKKLISLLLVSSALTAAIPIAADWLNPSVAPAVAQVPPSPVDANQLNPLGLFSDPGTWMEFRMQSPEVSGDMKITWLEREVREGIEYQWVELALDAQGERVISKRLTNLSDSGPIFREMIIKLGNEPAMLVSSEMLQMGMGAAFEMGGTPEPDAGEEPIFVGTETVTVGAGTFEVDVYEFPSDGEVVRGYIATSLPGVVLMEGDGMRMELMGSGNGGQSVITETPVPAEQLFGQ